MVQLRTRSLRNVSVLAQSWSVPFPQGSPEENLVQVVFLWCGGSLHLPQDVTLLPPFSSMFSFPCLGPSAGLR